MPEPEKVDASSQPFATGMQQQHSYKSLLNQQSAKIWKQLPVYQTNNEGSDHQPKFRTTVWVDGDKYTSPNTFQHRKLAETDACKVALFALMLKLKNEALQHVREDKRSCKSILFDYAVRMNVERPTYQTVQLGGSTVPVFRSTLVFNGVSYSGDDCRAKKEAEQSAAKAVILKCLDSETGNILSEIIKSKFNNQHATTTTVQNDTNEGKGDEGTKMTTTPAVNVNPPVDVITQTQMPTQTLTPNPVTPSVQVSSTLLTQTPPFAGTNNIVPTQTHVPQTPAVLAQTTPLTQFTPAASVNPPPVHATPMPTVQTPCVGTNNSAPSVVGHFANIPATHHSNVVQKAAPTTSTTIPNISSTQIPTPTVSMPAVLAQTPPFSGTNNNSTAPISLGQVASIPENQPFANNVVEAINTEAPNAPAVTGKKRNRKSKKNAQKRMRSDNQLAMSAIFQGQVPTFSAQ